jgi:ABC-type multidrug transport system fused ATPase/permease subunit
MSMSAAACSFARVLLQRADIIILDQSLAVLDPETLECALKCVLRRAPTLLVIAHRKPNSAFDFVRRDGAISR